jgi:predicted nucleic acid-binding protein
VLDELDRVLKEKLGFDDEHARAACGLLTELATALLPPPSHLDAVTGDPADDANLACAVEAQADLLATGDRKHLLPLGEHRGVRIRAPQAVLAELRADDESSL